jgi:tetratricopeptide (TPR) repeat protein
VSRTGVSDQSLEDLEVERDFLLRSLQDLEEEHAVGDVSDEDYARLHDSYTLRAAEVLRAIGSSETEAGPGGEVDASAADGSEQVDSSTGQAKKPVTRNRALLVVGVLLMLAGIAVAIVVSNTSDRLPGETATGAQPSVSAQQNIDREISQAEILEEEGQYSRALQLFQTVISQDPSNAVALSETGWLEFEAGVLGGSRSSLQLGQSTEERAVSVDPGLAAAHGYLGSMYFLEKNPSQAVIQYGEFIADQPSAAELDPFLPEMRTAFKEADKTMPPLTTAST